MKKNYFLIAFICFAVSGYAQTKDSKYGTDSVQTLKNASIYLEFVKQKNYTDALPAWRYVYKNAPAYQLNTYVKGEEIMLNMYLKTKKKAYFDTLMMVYDQRIQYFGNDPRYPKAYIVGKKGADLIRFFGSDPVKLKQGYTYLLESFNGLEEKVHPYISQMLLLSAGRLLFAGNLSADEFVDLYVRISGILTKQIAAVKKPQPYEEALEKVNAMFIESGVADAQTLTKLLTPRFNENRENEEVIKEILIVLQKSDATDIPLFGEASEAMYKLSPSYTGAYNLAVFFMKKKELEKADMYLKEALTKCTEARESYECSKTLALLKLTQLKFQEVKQAAMTMLKANPKSGEAYIILGKAYAFASKSYDGDDFEKHTLFWAAVDKFIKAKTEDPSVKEEANNLIAQYSQYFPSKEEAFFRSITEGSVVRIGGWINETTKARFK